MQITSFPGFGHPRLIPLFLDGCMSKQHQNYKRSCILALTNALRVWGCQSILEKHLRVISKAILAAASDRDPNGKYFFGDSLLSLLILVNHFVISMHLIC